MTTQESPRPEVIADPSTPVTKSEAKRLAREAKAVQKANRNWVARHKVLTGIGTLAALGVVIGVANGGDDAAPAASSAVEAPAVAGDAPAAAVEAPAAETKPAAKTGTRANPDAFGQTVTLNELGADTWSVTLSNPVLDATDAVTAANMFNEPAPEGMVYAMVTVDVTRLGEEAASPWVDLSVEFVSAAGTTHRSSDASAVAPAPSLLDLNDMYAGATGSGNVVIAIPQADVAAGTGNWTVSTMFGEPTFFALQ